MATGVTFEDIRQAIEELRSEQQSQSQLEASHVGNKQNQWQKPITEYGRNDPEWQVNLLASPFVGNIEVDDSDWKESMKTVDVVMKLLLIEIKSRAVKDFRGLRIGSYVRQGSSREGNIEVDSSDWEESRRAVDEVMNLLLKELRCQAEHYEGLRIDSYVRQGSSREGLKVLKADEYDAMLEFHFDGLDNRIQQSIIKKRNG
ncbi:hypothetical protein MAR_022711 [Mya arenaria]|uniref:Uncharacterized protein n=1 Tax=Mya arenaria TaxID=6604 RepID=A0ABY7DQG0_MYAAR|nr:hypothetical protein MAR_022711 [Mya arenaria]